LGKSLKKGGKGGRFGHKRVKITVLCCYLSISEVCRLGFPRPQRASGLQGSLFGTSRLRVWEKGREGGVAEHWVQSCKRKSLKEKKKKGKDRNFCFRDEASLKRKAKKKKIRGTFFGLVRKKKGSKKNRTRKGDLRGKLTVHQRQ